MSILEVAIYPDESLRQKCIPIETFDKELVDTVNSMIETMYHYHGCIGLAAPQVKVLKRILIVDVTAKTTKDNLLIMINPEIVSQSQNKFSREGCLSFPDYLADIKRAKKLTVKSQNIYGETFEYSTNAYEAVAIQHEIDHLDGILFIDRITSTKRSLIKRESQKDQ